VATDVIVYPAATVHTLEGSLPPVTGVAVSGGRVLAVGEPHELRASFGGTIDPTFEQNVLLPGFVEAHSHVIEGGVWQHTYCGYFDRTGPDGRHWPGCKSIAAVLARLDEANDALDDPAAPLLAWGLDPIYFEGEMLGATHLDRVSRDRGILVIHASLHLATVNTALMTAQGIDRYTSMAGVAKDASGDPTGELKEPPAMSLAGPAFRALMRSVADASAISNLGAIARNVGVTTLTDLGSGSLHDPRTTQRWRDVVDDPAFPARVSVFHNPGFGGPGDLDEAAALVQGLAASSSDKLRFGHVKLILDGSIQGFTARLRWPHYHGSGDNGMWLIPPEQVAERLLAFHRAGILVHAHCNGDEAIDVFLDAVEEVLAVAPRVDHRHTVQHCQLATPGQFRRMRALGLSANLFANHVFYWGDQHVAVTVGPDRAARMNAAATALDVGVPLSLHSDAAVTPLGSLHVVWCAVNRLTASGRVLGAHERIGVGQALRAVTVGAAHQLKMDDEIGTIAPGKRADFVVLDADPLEVDPIELRDVPVWGTVLGGIPRPAP